MGEKRIIITGFLMALVFGTSSFFIRDFGLLLAARALTGFGTGLISPFQSSLIPRHFDGYAAQRLFGLQSAGVSLLGVFYGLAGGALASIRWNYGFLVYLVALLGLALVTFWLPAEHGRDPFAGAPRKPFRFRRTLVYLTGMHTVFAALLFEFNAGIAYLLVERDMGDARSAGICVALFSLGAFACSLMYGRLQRRFGLSVLPWSYVMAAFGLLISGAVPGLATAYIGSIATGSSLGVMMPAISNRIITDYQDSNPTLAIAVFMGAFFTTQLFAPYVLQGVGLLPGGGTEAGKFLYAGSGAVLLAVFSGFTWKRFLIKR
jgi:MFS family permease